MTVFVILMAKKKLLKPGERVALKLPVEQADLIVEQTLIDDDLLAIIHHAKVRDGIVCAWFTLDELDDLAGYVAAEANNTKDKKLQQRFDAISEAIDKLSLSCAEAAADEPASKRHLSLVQK
jgi:hypothetical protein